MKSFKCSSTCFVLPSFHLFLIPLPPYSSISRLSLPTKVAFSHVQPISTISQDQRTPLKQWYHSAPFFRFYFNEKFFLRSDMLEILSASVQRFPIQIDWSYHNFYARKANHRRLWWAFNFFVILKVSLNSRYSKVANILRGRAEWPCLLMWNKVTIGHNDTVGQRRNFITT